MDGSKVNVSGVNRGADATENDRKRSESPERPPVSPITPIAPEDQNDAPSRPSDVGNRTNVPAFIPQPAPVPFSESENTDAVALRAAISVLQLQHDKSKQDIETLRQLKQSAIQQPELFTKELLEGKLKYDTPQSDPLGATFESDGNSIGTVSAENGEASQFPKIPTPQNIFRCPPINWDKYHVVGESLDRMHENQRVRPSPRSGEAPPTGTRETRIAAPYSPFYDDQSQTKSGSKRAP
ncbi:MAG: hypothetical protein M1828_006159 [Chrysothrix sp. TS-e1954]|nr:MAG: hypothetical protein M1828_006159 [Chrysothrix sp. TS-e1954]